MKFGGDWSLRSASRTQASVSMSRTAMPSRWSLSRSVRALGPQISAAISFSGPANDSVS